MEGVFQRADEHSRKRSVDGVGGHRHDEERADRAYYFDLPAGAQGNVHRSDQEADIRVPEGGARTAVPRRMPRGE